MNVKKLLITIISWLLLVSANFQREQIKIVGSSTLYPFITIAAEYFGRVNGLRVPIIESVGTGAGIKLFCSGVGLEYPDIATASRKIQNSEVELCKQNKVDNFFELILGYDGVVIAKALNGHEVALTAKDLYLALSKYIIHEGKIVENFYRYWHEINPKLAPTKIEIYGPAYGSGTRDTVTEALAAYCNKQEIIIKQYNNPKDRKVFCSLIREDGAYIESSENDNIIISKILQNTTALGLISFNYLNANAQKISPVPLDGSSPSIETIRSRDYKLSRPLYLYINKDHYNQVKDLKLFVETIQSEDYLGFGGILTKNGLISW